MADPISIAIAGLALGVSSLNAWWTLWHRGRVKMTQPTIIFMGWDPPRDSGEDAMPKVFLRTLLFATSKRGRIIESMHVVLYRNGTPQSFNVWGYAEKELVRGSGLFVGETGVAAYHHFVAPGGSAFRFAEGEYRIDVFSHLLGDRKQKLLWTQKLEIPRRVAVELGQPGNGLYFDWDPVASRYVSYVKNQPPSSGSMQVLELLGIPHHARNPLADTSATGRGHA